MDYYGWGYVHKAFRGTISGLPTFKQQISFCWKKSQYQINEATNELCHALWFVTQSSGGHCENLFV